MPIAPERTLMDASGAPLDPICGYETEYGVTCNITDPDAYNNLPIGLKDIAGKIASKATSLARPAYQESGARIYLDVGDHPEYSTAESTDFLDAAHRVIEGHIIMASLIVDAQAELSETYPGVSTTLIANTCNSYGWSWGCHANVLAPRALEEDEYVPALMVHNLSRTAWSGAGLVVARSSGTGFAYHLSEKAAYIETEQKNETRHSRPIVNLRDIPYADANKYRRIHDTTGDSVPSSHINALRLATTSMIMTATGLGVSLLDLMPLNPVLAMHQISRDPSLKTRVELADGRRYTALDLQMEIADRVIGAALSADQLTTQQIHWAENWFDILTDLRRDPEECSDRVIWVVKRRLIEKELTARHKAKTKDTDFNIAWQKALDVHQVGPEGIGMRMIRRGYLVDSPTAEQLHDGLEPRPTRARLRGRAVRRLNKAGLNPEVSWGSIKSISKVFGNVKMEDPYSTENSDLDELLVKAEEWSRDSAHQNAEAVTAPV